MARKEYEPIRYAEAKYRVRDHLAPSIILAAGLANLPDRTFADAVRELVAEGIRSKLAHQEKPISRAWLHAQDAATMPLMAFTWHDAVATEHGVEGPYQNRWKLEPVPDGCPWAEQGRQVYLVLAKGWKIAADGTIISALDGEVIEAAPKTDEPPAIGRGVEESTPDEEGPDG